ncbi:MAG: RluA family pseudouridine synthase [Clostridia bacterium]|nr:RluA family pseudouridine synthase [Clostridia bacterium]
MKLYTFVIPENQQPGRLYPLIRRMLPGVPDHAVRQAFDKRDVKQNGQRVSRDAELIPGAEVKLYTAYEETSPALPIVYLDEHIMVVHKPAGVSCQTDGKGGCTVAELAHQALKQKQPDAACPVVCHRLDNQTEGLLVLARTEEARLAMEEGFYHHRIHKRYTCIVKGTPQPRERTLRAWLRKDAAKARVQVLTHEAPGALPIITEYRVAEAGECARLVVTLHTGRTHQIRAQMAAIGHPLLGDDQYGDRAFNKQYKTRRLMLCATELRFAMEGRWAYLNELKLTVKPSF